MDARSSLSDRRGGARSRLRTLPASLLAAISALAMAILPVLGARAKPVRWPAHASAIAEPGSDRTLGRGELFVPMWQDEQSLLFLDLRGMGDTRGNAEGNFGLAFRQLIRESWIAGGYGFFDYRESDRAGSDNSFLGGVIGAEALSEDWDFRLNGYIPESGSKAVAGAGAAQLRDGTVVIRNGREKALGGLNGEIGWRLPIPDHSFLWDTRVFAGGYWFDAPGGYGGDIAGPRGRLEVRLHDLPLLPAGSRLTLGGEVFWDDPGGTEGRGLIRLRVPFFGYGGQPPDGSTAAGRLARRMTDPIQRDPDNVTKVGLGGSRTAYNPKNGMPVGPVYFAEEDGDGDGSQQDPTTLDDAIDMAGENGVVVALDSNGDVDVADGPGTLAELLDGQYLMGGGAWAFVADEAGKLFPFTAPGGRGTLFREDTDDPLVIAARWNTISGLNFLGGSIGIVADDPRNLMVMDSHFEGFRDVGIAVGDPEDGFPYDFMSTNNSFVDTFVGGDGKIGDGKAIAAVSPGFGTGRVFVDNNRFMDESGATSFDDRMVGVGLFAIGGNLQATVQNSYFGNLSLATLGYAIGYGDEDDGDPDETAQLDVALLNNYVGSTEFGSTDTGFAFFVASLGGDGKRLANLDLRLEGNTVETKSTGLSVFGFGFGDIVVGAYNNVFRRDEETDPFDGPSLAAISIGSLGSGFGDAKFVEDGNNLAFDARGNTIDGYLRGAEVAALVVDDVDINFENNALTAPETEFDEVGERIGLGVALGAVNDFRLTARYNVVRDFTIGLGVYAASDIDEEDGDVGFGVGNADVEIAGNMLSFSGDGKFTTAIDIELEDTDGADVRVTDNTSTGFGRALSFGYDFGDLLLAITGNSFTGNFGDSLVGVEVNSSNTSSRVVDIRALNNGIAGFDAGMTFDVEVGFDNVVDIDVGSNTVTGDPSGEGTAPGNGVGITARGEETDLDIGAWGNAVDGFEFGVFILTDVDDPDVDALDNTITDSGEDGLRIQNDGSEPVNVNVSGNTIDGAGDDGIDLEGNSGALNLPSPDCTVAGADNTVTNVGDLELETFGTNGTICVNGVNVP